VQSVRLFLSSAPSQGVFPVYGEIILLQYENNSASSQKGAELFAAVFSSTLPSMMTVCTVVMKFSFEIDKQQIL
jgi:hypothetical protein